MYQTQPTSKLFYSKWPYRIRCDVAGAWRVKRLGVNATLRYCQAPLLDPWIIPPVIRYREGIDKPRLIKFTNNVKPFLDKDLKIRVEQSIFTIYCKDRNLFESMKAALTPYITDVCEPANELEFDFMTTNSSKKIICNVLPHQKYRYKVYFKSKCNQDTKNQFESWCHNYGDKIKIPKSTVYWFARGYQQSPFVHIKDSSTLTMVGLFMGNNIHKVEEFILRSSINTCQDQEQVCQHSVSA